MVMSDRLALLRSNKLEIRLTMLIPFVFDKLIEASEAIF